MKECMSLSLCNLSLHSLWGVRDTVERERRGRDAKLREKRVGFKALIRNENWK